jgi:hypothetical protein
VAIATLIPIVIRSVVVLVPVACRRVGVTVRTFLMQAIWPALWPAAISLGLLATVTDEVRSFTDCALYGGATSVLYGALFIGLAIGRDERQRYVTKLRSITGLPALRPA